MMFDNVTEDQYDPSSAIKKPGTKIYDITYDITKTSVNEIIPILELLDRYDELLQPEVKNNTGDVCNKSEKSITQIDSSTPSKVNPGLVMKKFDSYERRIED